MRILLLTTEYPNPYDLTKAVFNFELARALSVRHEVNVIAPTPWVEEAGARLRLARPGRPAEAPGVRVYRPRYYYPPKVLRRQAGRFLWWSVRPTVRRVLRSGAPDIVLGYWAHPDGEVAVRTARLCGAAAGVIVGGSDILLTGQQFSRRGPIRSVLRSADAVIAIGRHLRQEVIRYGVDPKRVHGWDRGVDAERFSVGDRATARARLGLDVRSPVLLWVGRMVPVKAVDVLVEACGRLRGRGIPFHLCLVGEGHLRSVLEEQVAALGLSDAVTFVGVQPHDRLPNWYRAADLTILPSLSEGIPNVLRESLACGTRFVASRVGGIPEMATEPFDRLVPPNDPEALADAMAASLAGSAGGPPLSQARCTQAAADDLVHMLRPYLPHRPGHRWPHRPAQHTRTAP
jgi:teichuronic acid biosynthesis glycosyltransferase TuaC